MFSPEVMSDSVTTRQQHAKPPCPSLSPEVFSDWCPWSQWCDLPTSSHLLSHPNLLLSIFPSIRSSPVSWLFASCGQSTAASASASVLPVNTQGCFPLGFAALISLQSNGLSRVFSNTTIWKHQFFGTQPSLWSNSHICSWLLEKPELWLSGPFLAKWCLCILIR